VSNFIELKNVNLYYSCLAYRETSIKAFVCKLLGFKQRPKTEDVHALKNVSLKVNAGERVGLIGHNGAGKSTLLKTIASLYPITTGEVNVSGDIRALFELSLGFELEATGRENILYRGLLLGKKPHEMRELQQEIIDFADIGELIDYPIKTYSAGMMVRLAFAISTAVSGEILLLDEVIGAGDSDFMVKAKKRIYSLIDNAKILVLTSHDMSAIRNMCNRVVVVNHGEIVFDGGVENAIKEYAKLGQVAYHTEG